jgi:hypothetical protein
VTAREVKGEPALSEQTKTLPYDKTNTNEGNLDVIPSKSVALIRRRDLINLHSKFYRDGKKYLDLLSGLLKTLYDRVETLSKPTRNRKL